MYLKRKINILILLIIIAIIVISGIVVKINHQNEVTIEDFFVESQSNADITTDDSANKIKIHIDGYVKNPGIIEIEDGSRIADAIDQVGGLLPDASLKNVNLAYELKDGEKIYIPSKAEEIENQIQIVSMGDGESTENTKVNINTATIDELQKVSGIGQSTAQKIIDYRNKNGKFKKIEELKEITGIWDKKYDTIKEQVTV